MQTSWSTRATPRKRPRAWQSALLAAVLAAASCRDGDPESWQDDLALGDRIRLEGDTLVVDQICVRPVHRTVQELRLEVTLEQTGEPAAAATVLSLRARSSRPFTQPLCVGPAHVPGVRRGPGTRLVARLDAVVDGAYLFGEPVSIQ